MNGLKVLGRMSRSQKIIPTTIEFCDIAGLVKGASQGEGLGNMFLGHIRNVDAIAHVVRCFEDEQVTHVHGNVDPIADVTTINLELILADLELVEKRIGTESKKAKGQDREAKTKLAALEKVKSVLEAEKPARQADLSDDEKKLLFKETQFLTSKKVIYVANVSEDDLSAGVENEYVLTLRAYAEEAGDEMVTVSAKIESELSEMDEEEAAEFLRDLGIAESGFNKLIKAAYSLLDLISFLTTGGKRESSLGHQTRHQGTSGSGRHPFGF